MHLREFRDRLNERLDHERYASVDASSNGVQIGDDTASIDRAAFAVDAATETIEAAAAAGADVLVVHHGIIWGGLDRVTGREYERIAACLEHDLALYASHLPLDGHDDLGNAAGLTEFLGCERVASFGAYNGVTIGQQVDATEPYTVETLRGRLSDLDTGGQPVRALDFGPDRIESIAIVTGSGVDWIREAEAAGVDALITGEGKQQAYHEAKEAELNVFFAGHYATETFGVRALRTLVETWDIETEYLDYPTGI